MKILLIRPKNYYNIAGNAPVSLLSLGAVLIQSNHTVKIIDLMNNPSINIIDEIKLNYDFIGISCWTSEIDHTIKLCKLIRQYSKSKIVLGGIHPTLFPGQTVKSDLVDHVIVGEGELSFVRLVNGETADLILEQEQPLDLNKLPLPAYDLVDMEQYIKQIDSEGKPIRTIEYHSSRGCPMSCSFCINVVLNNRRYRMVSAEKVIKDITYLVKKYNLNYVHFRDDNFFVNRQRVIDICKGIKQLGIRWFAECRVDYFRPGHVDDELLTLCKEAGLYELTFGIESGSQRILDLMKKGITPDQSINAVKQANKYNIRLRCSFMIGLPGETTPDIMETISLYSQITKLHKGVSAAIGSFRPYPKCELSDKLIKQGLFTEPTSFEQWANIKFIELYSKPSYVKTPWQIDPDLIEKVCYYSSIASGTSYWEYRKHREFLKPRQLFGSFFVMLSRIRMQLRLFNLPIDMVFYNKMFELFKKVRGRFQWYR